MQAELGSPAQKDNATRTAILGHLLELYPAQLTDAEIRCEMTFGSRDFGNNDRVTRAVRDLIAAGLLHRNGDFLFPTRAAVLYDDLEW